MEALIVGTLAVCGIVVALRLVGEGDHTPEEDSASWRCEGCGSERFGALVEATPLVEVGRYSLACPACGRLDPRLAWLDADPWD